MVKRSAEDELRKKTIFDSMSPRRQKHILNKGYDKWDPFIEPQDPIDIRRDKTKRTSQGLISAFLQSTDSEKYNNEYGRGAFEICMGIINDSNRYKGMYDFACWYQELLKKEGYDRGE
ncbi:MAG: hypothetical protein R6U50_12925 [Desulfobacterales bacterium]